MATMTKEAEATATNELAEQPSKSKGLLAYEGFQTEIQNRADELASQLPSNVTRDRFINAAIAAVKQTPDILKANPRSLFSAITKAAQDGLLPDGREGVITVYGSDATWNPMIFGLRKRARELDGLIITAEVVYANDFFEREAGDDPKIIHKPEQLGKPRGAMIGAYAIFKHPTEGILNREVMDAEQIAKVREQSRAKNGLMWTRFTEEAWRKTVARRGFKSVPVSAALERLVQREDDTFDFNGPRDVTPQQHLGPPEPPEPPKSLDSETPEDAGDSGEDAGIPLDPPAGFDMEALRQAMAGAHSFEAVEDAFDEFSPQTQLADDEVALEKAFDLKNAAFDRIKREALTAAGQQDLLGGGNG